jgi:hypothetical protein
MRLTSEHTRVAMPWNRWCPHVESGNHQIHDLYRELIDPNRLKDFLNGTVAIACPICKKLVRFPEDEHLRLTDGTGTEQVFWQRSRWDNAPPNPGRIMP